MHLNLKCLKAGHHLSSKNQFQKRRHLKMKFKRTLQWNCVMSKNLKVRMKAVAKSKINHSNYPMIKTEPVKKMKHNNQRDHTYRVVSKISQIQNL